MDERRVVSAIRIFKNGSAAGLGESVDMICLWNDCTTFTRVRSIIFFLLIVECCCCFSRYR